MLPGFCFCIGLGLTPCPQTLDCGSKQISGHTQAKLFPGAQISTLEEVLDLVDCYGDKKVQLNLEVSSPPPPPSLLTL